MQIIPIQAIPNQQLDIVLENVTHRITLRTIKNGMTIADIERGSEYVIRGTRCLSGELLVPYRYLENGNFIFITKEYELPNYEQFGITQNLVFFPAEELAQFRANAGIFNLSAPLPLRYSRPNGYYIDGNAIVNHIRNNTMLGAAIGSPGTLPTNWASAISGGLSQQIVGVSEETSIQFIDWRIYGTASAAGAATLSFETTTAVTAANGQPWNLSSFIRMVGGSLANADKLRLLVDERTADGTASVLKNYSVSLAPTAFSLSTQRYNMGISLSGGGTVGKIRPSIELSYLSGAVIDVTLRFGLPQLETGLVAHNAVKTP